MNFQLKGLLINNVLNNLDVTATSRELSHEGFDNRYAQVVLKKNEKFYNLYIGFKLDHSELMIRVNDYTTDSTLAWNSRIIDETINISFVQSEQDIIQLVKNLNTILSQKGFSMEKNLLLKTDKVFKEALFSLSQHTYLKHIKQGGDNIEIEFDFDLSEDYDYVKFTVSPINETKNYNIFLESSSYLNFEIIDGKVENMTFDKLNKVFDYITNEVGN